MKTIFIVWLCMFYCFSCVAATECGERYEQQTYNDAWGSGMYVIKVDTGSTPGNFLCDQSSFPQNVSPDSRRMRIAYKCSSSSQDTKCVNVDSNGYQYYSMVVGDYHLEKVNNSGTECGFQCVKNNRDCNDFSKKFPGGSSFDDYKTQQNTMYDFANASTTNLCSGICANYISFKVGSDSIDNKGNKKGKYGYKHSNTRCSLKVQN